MFFQFGYHGEVASSGLTHLHANLRTNREIYIDTRAELDKSKMLVYVTFLSFLGIGDDTAGHGTSNLTAKDILALRCGDHHIGMLVLFACLGQPGFVEVAVEMFHEFHFPVNGEPVGMDVDKTHEYGNHQAAIMEVPVFIHFLYDHYLAVGRSYHHTFGIFLEFSYWATIEVEHYSPHRASNGNK